MTQRILLLEDAPALNSFLFTNLSPLGEVIRARSMIEAIVQADKFDPSVVVCDSRVEDLEGAALVREIRRECVRVPVVVVTCDTNANNLIAMIRAGAQDVVSRSAETSELQQIVLNAMDKTARKSAMNGATQKPAQIPADHVPISLNLTLEEAVDKFVAAKLERTGGSVPRAARELAISPSTLYRRLDKQRTSS